MKINKLKKLIREIIQEQTSCACIPGDLNGSGNVDQSDLLILQNIIFGNQDPNEVACIGNIPTSVGGNIAGISAQILNNLIFDYGTSPEELIANGNFYNPNAPSEVVASFTAAGCAPKEPEEPEFEVNCGLCGDADGDGVVTSQDAMLVLNYTTTNANINIPCLDYVDVSGDGSVNEVDAGLILDYVAGNITEFPGCSDSSDEIDLPTFCCDFDAFNFQPEVEGYNVNQIIMTNDPNNQCDNTLCTGCNDIDFESEVSSAGGVGPFCQKCMTNSWSGHPLEPYCECCPAGQRPLPLKKPVKDRMQKLAGIKPEEK